MKPSLRIQWYLGLIFLFLLFAAGLVFCHLFFGLMGSTSLKYPVLEMLALVGLLIGINKLGGFAQRRMAHLRAIGEAPPLPTAAEMEIEKKKIQRQRAILGVITIAFVAVTYVYIQFRQSKEHERVMREVEQYEKLQHSKGR